MADLERGQRIRQLRDHRSEEQGRLVAQPEVADAVGVTLRAVQDWEAGKGITLENAKKLAAYYGVSQRWLMYGEQNPLRDDEPSQLDRIEERQKEILNTLAALATRLDLRATTPPTAAPEERQEEETTSTGPTGGRARAQGQ